MLLSLNKVVIIIIIIIIKKGQTDAQTDWQSGNYVLSLREQKQQFIIIEKW